MGVLLKLSLLNMVRHKDRASFTIIGLALAIGVLFFVYSIGVSYQSNVSTSFDYVTRGGINMWLTPPHGFAFDPKSSLLFSNGSLPYRDYASMEEAISNHTLSSGTVAYAEIINKTSVNGNPFTIWGTTRLSNSSSPLQVDMNQQAANTLGVSVSEQFTLGGEKVVFASQLSNSISSTNLLIVPLNLAFQLLQAGSNSSIQNSSSLALSWIVVDAPFLKPTATWVSNNLGFVESTSPTASINSNTNGIAFILPSGFYRYQVVSFSSELSSLSLSRVISTSYGLLADICLGLGFILVVSTAILNIEERRRELGIWSALGIAEDTFFVFLIESVFVYLIALAIGFGLGIVFSAVFAPWTLQVGTLVSTCLAVSPYFPTLVIVGSLIPLQILLNKKPLDLLLNR